MRPPPLFGRPGGTRTLVKLASQVRVVLRPVALDVGTVLDELREARDLGVEIVEVVQCDGFERHRQL